MNISTKIAAASLLTAVGFAGFLAYAADDQTSVSIPADQITFGPTGVKTDVGELKAGPAYGNLATGKHGTFVRMPAHFVSPLHTHTGDYYGVVIQGVTVNEQDGKNDVNLPVGSYWFQRGKQNHVTKCVSDADCLFFIVQSEKFDYVPAK
jgi:hypothetical protein